MSSGLGVHTVDHTQGPACAIAAGAATVRQHPLPDAEIHAAESSSLSSRFDEAIALAPSWERDRQGCFRGKLPRQRTCFDGSF
jgi:hypothetical protein